MNEIARAEALQALIVAGACMAGVMDSLEKDETLSPGLRKIITEYRQQWDSARDMYREALRMPQLPKETITS